MQRFALFSLISITLTALSSLTSAQAQAPLVPARITQAIDEGQLMVLRGHTYPLARAEFDQGPAAANLPMEHMLLVLSRSSAQEAALEALLNQQLDKTSLQYHKWLTPQQFGQQFGAADQDIQTVTGWLESKGFQVNRVSNGKSVIDFSGTAEQVENAFHTEIHKYVVNGEEHWANAGDPAIPAALAPAVANLATLHNFYKKPQLIRSNQKFEAMYQAGKRPQVTFSDGSHALGPGDFLTIYGVGEAGMGGGGTTIGVVGRSNIHLSDISGPNGFRAVFDLPDNPPQVVVNGTDPGDLGGDEEAEAVLDTSWAGAIAPVATVKLVVSKSGATDGVDLSELYIIDNNLADVMTESFGACEANYTQADANYYLSLAQQAAAEGITYVVAAGDSGAKGCDDPGSANATGPLSVNILAATPYNIAVGGTEFHEGNGSYWLNDSGLESAIGYIPEEVWNESCTASAGVNPCAGGNSPGLWAGGGGASRFSSKPSWQAGVVGIPSDGARDVPDVSLTAAGHDAYLLCIDASCTPDSNGLIYFQGYAGTSAATPSFAGIMALIVQQTGSRQGQADAELYALAANDIQGSCNASDASGGTVRYCVFNDITVGNNAVPGEAGYGTAGAAYQAGVGYDLATGLGSVNIAYLMNRWSDGLPSQGVFIYVLIDQPSFQNPTFMGLSELSGAAIRFGAAITTVAIAIDGVPYGTASYGASRPDACEVFDGAGCPDVGWSISVDTTQLSNGPHRLDVTASSTLGDHFTTSASFTVANWSTADPMIIDIGNPGSSSSGFSGVVDFGGWAIDKTGAISSMSISIDGVPYGNATYGGSRPDVCAVYPGTAGCPNVGWNFGLDTTVLADGTHTLGVTGFTAIGQNTTVTRTFTTSNLSGSKIMISIDQPSAQSGPFSGPAAFGGWALDNTV